MSGGSETYFGLNLDPDIIRWEPKKGLELLNQNFLITLFRVIFINCIL